MRKLWANALPGPVKKDGRQAALVVCLAGCLAACGATLNNDLQATLTDPSETSTSTTTASANGVAAPNAPASIGATTGSVGSPAAQTGAVKSAISGKGSDNPFAPGASAAGIGYRIGQLDVLEVSVFKVPELSRSVQVAAAGTINLPLLGEVQAVGKTPDELERSLAKQLGEKYLQNPQVSVYVKEYKSQRLTIEGGVKKPGMYPLAGQTSLLQAIAQAGGMSELSDESNVVVFRRIGTKRHAARFDVSAIRSGTTDDPMLKTGDVVVVHNSAAKTMFNNITKIVPITNVFVPFI